MERYEYFVRRLLLVIPTFIGITFLCYLVCQFVPGGPVEQILAQMRGDVAGEAGLNSGAVTAVTAEQKQALIEHFGFDQPFLKRYWDWLVHQRLGMTVDSYKYPNKTVWQLIVERFPISLTFGLTGFFLTYLICIPLGVAKALRHGTRFDLISSIVVFIGYAIPGFAFGMVLKTVFCGTSELFFDWFPIAGFTSDNFQELNGFAKIKDLIHHMFLPIVCYVIGNFAVLTLLMKNSLLDQVGQDYVRTVLAKGGSLRRAIWGHAFRNSLIPIATGFGGILTIILAGSVLIEKVFEIPGMGLLSLDAIVSRDYMVFMGIVSISSLLGLVGNILSDFCYVIIDPRINFQK